MNPLLLCSLHVLVFFIFHSQAFNSSSSTPMCHPEESSALLNFKASLTISSSASWFCEDKTALWNESFNCCEWDGIECDEATGHVIKLDLRCIKLKGIISSNSSLFSLRHLHFLSLSRSNLRGSEALPLWLKPYNYLYREGISIEEATLRAVAMNLTELTVLDLYGVDMSAVNSLSVMANLSSSLTLLSMRYCGLNGELPEAFFGNFRKLKYLSLRGNNLHGRVSLSSLNMEHLSEFDLSDNNFSGRIPEIYGNFSPSSLEFFRLRYNSFEGIIPSWIFEQPSLKVIDVSNNHFSGELEIEKISELKDLSYLSLFSNNFTLNFRSSKNLFLDNMVHLDFSYSNINVESTINISLNNLRELYLRSCNIKEFPNFLKSSKRLQALDISQNSIHGNVPKWVMELGKDSLYYLNLSHNFLTHLESFSYNDCLQTLDLRSNSFRVPLLNLSSMPGLRFLSMSKNHFVGNIPIAFCKMSSLELLDLSNNSLSGTIPRCITNSSSSLTVLDLQMNNLHGSVPSNFAKGNSLRTLNLNGNRLEGSLHRSLLNCKMLEVFDIGGNKISGPFPQWLESLPELQVLILKGNKFYGPIGSPMERFSFKKLRIMDLSHNEFTGSLPNKYFENLSAMIDCHTDVLEYMESGYYHDSVAVVMKGSEVQPEKILTMFTTIDLSSNNFEGHIPSSIGNLKSLKGLNLSHNNLVGHIPISLGNLSNMEWLDLSWNNLNGEIPNILAALTQLSFLDLSFNALVGPIPLGPQFNTFGNKSYIGNLGLCGFPLSKTCLESPTSTEHGDIYQVLDWKIMLFIGYGGGLVFGVSMGFVLIHDKTVYRILEIVKLRNQGSSKKLNGRKIRRK